MHKYTYIDIDIIYSYYMHVACIYSLINKT